MQTDVHMGAFLYTWLHRSQMFFSYTRGPKVNVNAPSFPCLLPVNIAERLCGRAGLMIALLGMFVQRFN